MRTLLLCAALALAFTSGCSHRKGVGGTSGDHNVLTGGPGTGTRISDLPRPVRDTLKKQVPSGEVADIDKQILGSDVVYKISFTDPSNTPSLYIAQDGRVVQGQTNREKLETGR